MTGSIEVPVGVPIKPCTSAFSEYRLLRSLYECWEQVRGDKMMPTKHDFERAMLEYPEILPKMVLAELVSNTEFHYLYVGSDRVSLRNKDQTRQNVKEAFAPKIGEFVTDWARASLKKPHIAFWKGRSILPSGKVGGAVALTVILSNDEGLPNYVATVTVTGEVYAREIERDGYHIGSAGMEIVPIDIGCGVPDLPRTVA